MVKLFKFLLGDLPTVLDKTFVISIDPEKRFKQTFFTITNVIMTTGCVISIYMLGVQKSLDGAAYNAAMSILILGKQLIYFSNPAQVNKLLDSLKMLQNHHNKPWEKEMFDIGSLESKKAVNTYWTMVLSYQMFVLTLSAVSDFIIGNIFPQAPSLLVELPGRGIIDLFKPRTLGWLVVTTLFIVWGYTVVMIHIGTESLTFVPISYVKIEMKMLQHKLAVVKENLEKVGNNHRNSDMLLVDIIMHHQRTLKVLNVMKKTLGLPLFIQNTSFSVITCLDFYCIFAYNEISSLAVKLNGVGVVICIGLLLFTLCYHGESLEKENQKIRNCIYDLPWFNQGTKFRRSVQIMLSQAQKPYVINYHLIANLNLAAYMEIMNTTYSYFMVLKSMV
nr:odorant receptor 57 [Graphosoma rubrolineatum]